MPAKSLEADRAWGRRPAGAERHEASESLATLEHAVCLPKMTRWLSGCPPKVRNENKCRKFPPRRCPIRWSWTALNSIDFALFHWRSAKLWDRMIRNSKGFHILYLQQHPLAHKCCDVCKLCWRERCRRDETLTGGKCQQQPSSQHANYRTGNIHEL
jgi:hypothetical protein